MRGLVPLLVATIAWGAFTAGAKEPWAYWPLAAAVAALGLVMIAASRAWRDGEWRAAAAVLGPVAGAVALQLAPLPLGVFSAASPAARAFLDTQVVGFALAPPAWHALSIAPVETAVALALLAALALVTLGVMAAAGAATFRRLAAALMAVGVVVGVFGVLQRAALGTSPYVYGFWKAPELSTPFGPFFNRNHFAGWMVLVLGPSLGYAVAVARLARPPAGRGARAWAHWLSTTDASRALVVGFAALVMAAALVLSGSRSGIVALAVTAAVLAWRLWREMAGRTGRGVVVGLTLAFLGAAVLWAGAGETFARFSLVSDDLPGRVAAWRDTLRIIADFAWTGTGLGTYGTSMIAYQTTDRAAIFTQAHNDYLQLAAEGGLLVGLPVLLALVRLTATALRRLPGAAAGGREGPDGLTARWVRAGAAAGLVGIAAQSVVEYSLQRPGIAALAAVLAGVVLSGSSDRSGGYANRL